MIFLINNSIILRLYTIMMILVIFFLNVMIFLIRFDVFKIVYINNLLLILMNNIINNY